MDEPMTLSARRAKRAEIRRNILAAAEKRALEANRSMKCSGNMPWYKFLHADDEDGCRNDGSGCLCECHDPKGA